MIMMNALCVNRAMDAKLANLKAAMDLTRTWLHIDMDAFFASVEELDEPSLVMRSMRLPCACLYFSLLEAEILLCIS